MRLNDANQLLEPGNLALGCKGRMVDFWFGFLRTTEQYGWWHPKDHVWCNWIGERGTGQYVGGTHQVHEYIGGWHRSVRASGAARRLRRGCEMRSRFWLGDFEPQEVAPTPEVRGQLFPDRVGAGLHKHRNEEMAYLAQFLPDLYRKETRE